MKQTRLSIFMSHPIQYQISLIRNIASEKEIDLTVYYYWDFGVKETFDKEFNTKIKWDMPLFGGYKHSFLRNYAFSKSTSFFGCINFGVISKFLKNKPDVVLIFGWALFSNWIVMMMAFISKTPLLIYGESPLSHEFSKSGFRSYVRKILLNFIFSRADKLLYIGSENKKFYKSLGIKDTKLVFVPYSVDNKSHLENARILKPKKQQIKQELGLSKDSVVVLFTGKLIEKKRPFDLLKAFEISQKSLTGKNTYLLFAGDGEQKQDLEKYTKSNNINNVIFLGFQNQTKLPKIYTVADLFVLPSGLGETWGLVVNEAMYYGLPIIVSNLVGCSSDLVTSNNGRIFTYGDVNELSENIVDLVLDEKLREELGANSPPIVKYHNQEYAASQIAIAATTSKKNIN